MRRLGAGILFGQWPGGMVPYETDDVANWTVVTDAMRTISNAVPAIRFRRRVASDAHWVYVTSEGDGCSAPVGWQWRMAQHNLTLGEGCRVHRIALHELLHILGLTHEMQRRDRDEWVTINWENVQEDKQYNFETMWPLVTYGAGYDCLSLMQYADHDFAINASLPTIVSKKCVLVTRPDNASMSEGDVLFLKKYYADHDYRAWIDYGLVLLFVVSAMAWVFSYLGRRVGPRKSKPRGLSIHKYRP